MLPDPSTSAPRLVADNLLFLSQVVELLDRLADRPYLAAPSLKVKPFWWQWSATRSHSCRSVLGSSFRLFWPMGRE